MGDLVQMNGASVKHLLDSADWRPITQYDMEMRPSVLLRGVTPHHWTYGYWGVLEAPWLYDDKRSPAIVREPKPFWRKAIDWDKGLPLNFDPVDFAIIDEKAVDRLPQS